MGDRFKGLVHPCKVYNIIAIGAPFLYIGPEESHVSDLLQEYDKEIRARSVRHGEVEEVVAHVREAAGAGPIRKSMPEVTAHFSSHALLPRMISILDASVENAASLPARTAAHET